MPEVSNKIVIIVAQETKIAFKLDGVFLFLDGFSWT